MVKMSSFLPKKIGLGRVFFGVVMTLNKVFEKFVQRVLHYNNTKDGKLISYYARWFIVQMSWCNNSWFRVKISIDGSGLNNICIDFCRCFWCSSFFLTFEIHMIQSKLFTRWKLLGKKLVRSFLSSAFMIDSNSLFCTDYHKLTCNLPSIQKNPLNSMQSLTKIQIKLNRN